LNYGELVAVAVAAATASDPMLGMAVGVVEAADMFVASLL
jgi:hypothetical protein